eukprot:TRINITY_DN7661_c0_g1_i2.p1 TRINITY_DN7661_c0_g1~~TRINITY_DN7661_c0_g1_i2.p1  ORF type:complete len:458 (-),score=184.07 TRINITY_DN7661_c0_g1_i2:35-1408(-)
MLRNIVKHTNKYKPLFNTLSSNVVRQESLVVSNLNNANMNFQYKNFLNIHEYQSQHLMEQFNVKVPAGGVAKTPDEAAAIVSKLGVDDCVIKAQVLAGGRGKGTFDTGFKGGVHLVHDKDEVKRIAKEMLGNKLITKQTGEEGKICNKVLIAKRHYIRREMYFAIVLDRKTSGVLLIGSKFGGMNIEDVAEENPDAIVRIPIDIMTGITEEQALQMAEGLGCTGNVINIAKEQIINLYKLFTQCDCTQVEVNPLVETADEDIMCLDAKINFDDNASFRQNELFEYRDFSQEDNREVAAAKYDLNFIGLDGNIGCLVNGAGLAMATMDIIQLNGGSPANFLDIGGGANEKQVTEALKIIASDKKVKAILVNIFGGIMRCDVIAAGILKAVEELNLKIPLVVRLSGTRVNEAREIIETSGMRVIAADNLDDAAKKAVTATSIVEIAEKVNLNVSFELPL